jgi:membrane complex biogenesis BtpA family protein
MKLFDRSRCALIGCVHLLPLPGSAGFDGDVGRVVRRAAEEARLLVGAGFDGLIVENTHDAPYLLGSVPPETTAAVVRAATAVRDVTRLPIGVQVLAGANRESLAVAIAAELDFVRVESFVFAHVADEGLMATAAAPLLVRLRAQLRAERVAILADVKKKHASHAITSDLSLRDVVEGAAFSRADGVIVTGASTGRETDAAEVREASEASVLPVFVGSGVTPANVGRYVASARGLIVGSSLKKDGDWRNELEPARLAAMRAALDQALKG